MREEELRKFPKLLRGLVSPFVGKKNKNVKATSNTADAFAALLKGRSASEEAASELARQAYESSFQARFVLSARAMFYMYSLPRSAKRLEPFVDLYTYWSIDHLVH